MTIYTFDGFRFDAAKSELTRDGERIASQPRVLALLAYLLERRDRLVTKAELVETQWEGRSVSDDAVAKRITLLRKALGDTGRQNRLIRSMYGKGLQFVGEVEATSSILSAEARSAPRDDAAIANRAKAPRLAILPFRLDGQSGKHTSIAEGLPDDITSSLVKLRSLPIIARASAFRFGNVSHAARAVGEELSAGYAVAGRVRLEGDRAHIYAELLRTADESLVWSERYSGDLSDIHAIREEIVGKIVSAVEIAVPREEARRARLQMPSQLDAWEAYHIGQSLSVEAVEPDYPRAETYFRRAIDLDPAFARARCSQAYVHWNFFSAQSDREENRLAMLAQSEKALSLDPEDPVANMTYGVMHGSLGDLEVAHARLRKALDLAPNYARAHASIAGILAARGQVPESIEAVERAVTLSPRDPHLPTWIAIRLVGNTMLGKLDEVHADADLLADRATKHIVPLGWALTGYSLSGDTKSAKVIAARLRKLLPAVPAESVPGVYIGLPAPLRALLEKSFRDFGLVR